MDTTNKKMGFLAVGSVLMLLVPSVYAATDERGTLPKYDVRCSEYFDKFEDVRSSEKLSGSQLHQIRRCISTLKKQEQNAKSGSQRQDRVARAATRNQKRTAAILERATHNTKSSVQRRIREGLSQAVLPQPSKKKIEEIREHRRIERTGIRSVESSTRDGVRYRSRVENVGNECLRFKAGKRTSCVRNRMDEIIKGNIKRR